MTLLKNKSLKTVAAIGSMVFFMSCTNEIPEVTGGLIDNSNFERDTLTVEPTLSTIQVDTVRTNILPTYLFGDYTNPAFGNVKAGYVGQLTLDKYPDTVAVTYTDVKATLEFPLSLAAKEDNASEFELVNFIGDYATEFDVTVSSFTTFLEFFNADGSRRIYYSDGTNNSPFKKTLGVENVIGTKTGLSFLETYTSENDTLISIDIDANYVRDNILAEMDRLNVTTDEGLISIFKGIKLDAVATSGEGAILPFDVTQGGLKVTYTKTKAGAVVENDTLLMFEFDRVFYNTYNHDHAQVNSTELNYVQGAGGYETEIDISTYIDTWKTQAQDNKWLVNQAFLNIYLDDVNDDSLEELYIYGVDEDGKAIAVADYNNVFGSSSVDGIVRYEDVDNNAIPFVRFFITDLIKNELSGDEDRVQNIKKLRIKSKETGERATIDFRSTTAKGALLINGSGNAVKKPIIELIYSNIIGD